MEMGRTFEFLAVNGTTLILVKEIEGFLELGELILAHTGELVLQQEAAFACVLLV